MTAPPPSAARKQPGQLRNVVANWGAFVVAALINFWLSPLVVRGLGDTAYGIWVLLTSLVGYMGLLDLGVRGAVTRYVARHHAAHEDADSSRIASAALAIFAMVGAAAIVVAAILAFIVLPSFNLPTEFLAVARAVMLLGGVTVALSLIGGVYGGVVAGLQRFDVLSGTEIAAEVIRAALVIAALRSGAGLLALAAIQLTIAAARALAFKATSRRLYPELVIGLKGWGRTELREVFSYGAFSSALNIAGSIVYYANSVIIGAFLPVYQITYYSIGGSLTMYARTVVSAFSQPVTPRISALERERTRAELTNVVLDSGRLAALALLPIAITFQLRGASFIGLWMGPSYAEASGRVLSILTVALWVGAGRQVTFASMLGLNRHRRLVPYFGLEAVINVLLCIAWVRPFGIEGVAWGMTLPNVVQALVVLPLLLRSELGTPVTRTWLAHLGRPALAMLPFAGVTYAIERFAPASNLFVFFLQVGAALLAAGAGAWLAGFTRAERQALVRRFSRRPGAISGVSP